MSNNTRAMQMCTHKCLEHAKPDIHAQKSAQMIRTQDIHAQRRSVQNTESCTHTHTHPIAFFLYTIPLLSKRVGTEQDKLFLQGYGKKVLSAETGNQHDVNYFPMLSFCTAKHFRLSSANAHSTPTMATYALQKSYRLSLSRLLRSIALCLPKVALLFLFERAQQKRCLLGGIGLQEEAFTIFER